MLAVIIETLPNVMWCSVASLAILKFYVNHHWVGGLTALGFETDCIKIPFL